MLDDQAYSYFKHQIQRLLNINIDAYKQAQMRRRLSTFLESQHSGSPMVFLRRLDGDEETLAALRNMLTINVTEFFRDSAQFESLQSDVLPQLLRPGTFRVWSAGCSLGDEPYTLAIILDELGRGHGSKILATDIDRGALSRARAGGPYRDGSLRGVSPQRLDKYFRESDDGHYIDDKLRSRVQFRELDLLSDPFGTGYDLIVCRNVIIYFDMLPKKELVHRFRDALRPGGVLFIGATEALLGGDSDGLERMRGNFYRKPADDAAVSRAA